MPGDQLSADKQRTLESFMHEWMMDAGVPASSIAIVSDGETVFADGFGSRNLALNRPATARTLYGIGSCTKSFTAMAIMQLAEAGDLDVHDPVTDYVRYDLDEGEDITLHHFLTHSAGAPSDGWAHVLIARHAGVEEKAIPMANRRDFHVHLNGATDEIAAPPGERFFYYNTGYGLLGEIVEDVSGQPFDSYVREHILDPLGMDRTTFSRETFETREDAMVAYKANADGDMVPAQFPFDELIYAAGGLLSPVEELATYLKANLNGGTHDGVSLISEDGHAQMTDGYIQTGPGISGIAPQRYGYGWAAQEFLDERLIGHSGSIGVSTAYMGFMPDRNLGVAVTCNASPGYLMEVIGLGALAIMLDGDWRSDVSYFAANEGLDRLTGTYRSYRGVNEVEVSKIGGMLEIQSHVGYPPWADIPVIPEDIDNGEFFTLTDTGQRQEITFEEDGDDLSMYIDRWRLHKID